MATTSTARVLVIDDEPDVRRIIADTLADEGFGVDVAGSGEDGLELLRGEPFDLAYVDINLPGLSGFEVLETIRDEGLGTDIVIVTGKATVANAVEATRRGAYDYVTKPFDLDALVDLAHRIVEHRPGDGGPRRFRAFRAGCPRQAPCPGARVRPCDS